jgi:hypothetical protein
MLINKALTGVKSLGSRCASIQTLRPTARRAFESYLSRARWMTEQGYRHLLRGGA